MNRKHPRFSLPIDAVYLWVDGSDSQWQLKKKEIIDDLYGRSHLLKDDVASVGRFADNDELKYSLRSLALHASWINNVYIVTDNQCPRWINRDKVTIVDHNEIFPENASLPCFNSHAIELCIHRIKGLSEHFLLFNDDFFLGSAMHKYDVFKGNSDPVLWVLKKRKKYKNNLLSDKYMHMRTHRGADVYARRLILKKYNTYLPYRVRHYPKPMLR